MLLSHRIKKVLVTTTAAAGILVAGAGAAGAASASNVTVHSGDTLTSISQRNNVSLSELEQANHLGDSSIIYAGQQLTLPGTDNTQVTAPTQQTTSSNQSAQNTTSYQPNVQTQNTNVQSNQTQSQANTQTTNSGDSSAKSWIANHESSNSYGAQNGQYVGKYQLDASYLNGDYSAANQERVADQYVASRYGSWNNAQSFWQSHGWY